MSERNRPHDSDEERAESDRQGGEFPNTRWSLVVGAAGDDSRAERALSQLVERYWYPCYVYLRRTGYGTDEARDLIQEFVAHLLSGHRLDGADASKGRFRSYLLGALKHFVSKERRKRAAVMRGGRAKHVALDFAEAEEQLASDASSGKNPEAAFSRRWATAVLESVTERLRRQYERRDQQALFDALESHLAGDGPQDGYAAIASKVGMSREAVKVAAFRLRERFRVELRLEVAETLADVDGVDDELRFLLDCLRA